MEIIMFYHICVIIYELFSLQTGKSCCTPCLTLNPSLIYRFQNIHSLSRIECLALTITFAPGETLARTLSFEHHILPN